MDVSDGQGSGGAIEFDCSAGSIVWVRRRNGSWWPGKIVGTDELSTSHLMSPRSGTPVKLLGREDASVDWYNFEKSKRVKPFRCGEFDDCIDKAEKSLGVPIKKREKYARREDAILHALELERQKVEKKEKKEMNANSATSKNLSVLKELSGKQSSGEEDISRMRGLQDFGLRIAPKSKVPVDNHVRSGSQSLERTGAVSSSRSLVTFKRKRSQGGLVEESLNKRRDRHRHLVQVLQTSAILPSDPNLQRVEVVSPSMQGEIEQAGVICRAKRSRCVYLPAQSNEGLDHTDEMRMSPSRFGMDNCDINQGSLTEENTTSGSLDNAETDSCSTDEETDDDRAMLSDCVEAQPMTVGPINGHIQGPTESVSSEDEAAAAAAAEVDCYLPRHQSHNQASSLACDLGVSKWKSKGKRNIRSILKKPNDYLKGNWSNQLVPSRFHGSEDLDYDYNDDEEEIEENPPMYNKSERRRHLPSTVRVSPDVIDSEEDPIWEMEGLASHQLLWDDAEDECYDPIYSKGKKNSSILVDVEVKVHASSYQGEHVPLVSLMSRLNGKAIIGHPIQVEEVFLSTDFREEAAIGSDAILAAAPMWTTGRRTSMPRVPRPHPCTTSTAEDPDDPPIQLYRPTERKPLKRPMKKVSSLSSQKTRTLSSIAIDQRVNAKKSGGGGLIKPENGTTVTCIPVKLVFSRLLAAVGTPPAPKLSS